MLLEEFSTIFDRPEKVKKLREYILSLAVRGKLVAQDENDEPASVLLDRIREEKDRLVKEKKIKKEKPLPEISEDEIPYEIPKGWEWVRFSQVLDVRDGTHDTPKYVEKGIPLITSKNINGKDIDFSNVKYISEEDHEEISKRSQVDDGDILFAMIGSIGNPVIVKKHRDFSIKNVALFKYYNNDVVLNTYLYYYLVLHQSYMKERASGAVQSFVSLKFLRTYEFALPPLNEQKRIVEKVDYLMEFCDKLEAQLEKKVKYGSLSAKSVLNGVSNCSSYEELEEVLRFIIENFKDLTLADGAIGELKNAILSLAVKGKLVQQDDSDEPASVLLDRIRKEKDRLVKEKKIKKEKPIPEISEDEIPYELPKGWEWSRLGNLGITQTGTTPSTKNPEYFGGNIPFIKPADISGTGVVYNNESLTELGLEKGRLIESNSVLMVCIGGSIGKNYFIDRDCSCNQQINSITGLCGVGNKFIHYFISSSEFYRQIISIATGSATPIINKSKWEQLLVQLPPLNEQKRIVEKVDKLMEVCEELELKIEKSKEYSEKLKKSILKNSFKV